jgi:hypothetical protein
MRCVKTGCNVSNNNATYHCDMFEFDEYFMFLCNRNETLDFADVVIKTHHEHYGFNNIILIAKQADTTIDSVELYDMWKQYYPKLIEKGRFKTGF